MMIKAKTIILIITICLSCSNPDRTNIMVIDTQEETPTSHNLSELFEIEDIVKLSTTDTSLIRNISSIVKNDTNIFIVDYQKVLKFSNTGQYLGQIGSYGKGPGEYRGITSICLNNNDNLIAISSDNLLLYDLNGNFLKSIKTDVNSVGSSMYFIDTLLWVYNFYPLIKEKNDTYITRGLFYIYDKQLNFIDNLVVKHVLSNNNFFTVGGSKQVLSVLPSGKYIYCPIAKPEPILRDTLYLIDNKKLKPVIKFDFSKILTTSENVTLNPGMPDYMNAHSRVRSVTITGIYRTELIIFVNYHTLFTETYLFCYDMFNQKSYHMPKGFTDDLCGTEGQVNLIPLDLQKGEFCFIKNGYEVEGIIDRVTENSNPVIFMLKLKM